MVFESAQPGERNGTKGVDRLVEVVTEASNYDSFEMLRVVGRECPLRPTRFYILRLVLSTPSST